MKKIPGRLLVLLLAMAAACANIVNFEGKDRGVFFPELRASWPVPAGGSTRPESIELMVSRGSGDSSQTVAAGDSIQIGGMSLGPGVVQAEYELLAGSVVGRWRRELDHKTWLDLYAGLGFTHLDLDLRTATERAQDTTTSIGLDVGFRFLWEPKDKVALFFGLGQRVGWGSSLVVPLTQVDVGVEIRPKDHFTFFGGWRWWFYEEDRAGSDIDLELSGPLAGLRIDF